MEQKVNSDMEELVAKVEALVAVVVAEAVGMAPLELVELLLEHFLEGEAHHLSPDIRIAMV